MSTIIGVQSHNFLHTISKIKEEEFKVRRVNYYI